jgi:hypothetical protein
MVCREIYVVTAYIVDANGTFNALTGYPKTFDSKNYGHDLDKTRQRAYGDWHDVLGAMCKVDTREVQIAGIVRVSDGMQIESARIGNLKELPDPELNETT